MAQSKHGRNEHHKNMSNAQLGKNDPVDKHNIYDKAFQKSIYTLFFTCPKSWHTCIYHNDFEKKAEKLFWTCPK